MVRQFELIWVKGKILFVTQSEILVRCFLNHTIALNIYLDSRNLETALTSNSDEIDTDIVTGFVLHL